MLQWICPGGTLYEKLLNVLCFFLRAVFWS
jgi:hypothetical protein